MNTQLFSVKALALASVLSLGVTLPAIADHHAATDAVEGEAMEAVEETAQGAGDIVDVASSVEDFSTLVAAVEAAGLVDALKSEGPFTVLAPTNDAFAALPDGVLDALLLPENEDLLTEILTYHVIPGEVPSADITTGPVPTLNGDDVMVTADNDMIMADDAMVVAADVPASNGIIHVLDAVLVPDDVAEELGARLAAAEEVEEPAPAEPAPAEPAPAEPAPAEPVRGLW
ncbi:MAG: fasciclin domain-containing protein [Cyanobacteria bacterium P01_D01_bin.115]